ncbi:MAG TPA: YceI family protein [Sphingobacteriaceae bacterium]|nr:YceI family protein [Sphingobacteriaceae bacterium]
MKLSKGLRKLPFTLTLILLVMLFSSFGTGQTRMTWRIHPSSSIKIHGSSNVNTFGCTATGTFQSLPIACEYKNTKANMQAIMQGSVTVEIRSFDCKNRLLDNDLRKTLKADDFPLMTIQFLELERLPDVDSEVDFLSGKVQIDLAGKQRQFYLRYAFNKTPNGYLLKGSRAFTFADFDLTPPKKVGGLIRVNDDFDVGFTLVLIDVDS